MPETAKAYKKHNSFVEIRQKKPLADAKERLERLYREGGAWGLDPARARVARQACRELLGLAAPSASHAAFRLHHNVQEELARLEDRELARYLFYRFRYEAYPERHILDSYPPCLQIEPTSVCNFRCVFCYQTDAEFTSKKNGHMGMMALDTFKRVVDEATGQIEAVTLASRGEPMACPAIKEMLAYAAGKFLALKVNTNASLLDEAKCHAILEAGVSTVVFSADAAVEPDYGRLRVGGGLQKVLKNVRMFAEIKSKHYPRSRLITRVSGVQVPGSGGLDEMERFWGECVDQVAFVKYNPWENAYTAPLSGLESPCSDLWRRMFVWWDGRANPCDVDFKSTLAVGSAAAEGLSRLWRSEAYERLREDHLAKRRSQRSPCDRCTVL
ncbi:MAG: radical SAM protein [Elusimicrobia bacterium]|nr:radical SAM protein [Elusimicrobiota bacterium]